MAWGFGHVARLVPILTTRSIERRPGGTPHSFVTATHLRRRAEVITIHRPATAGAAAHLTHRRSIPTAWSEVGSLSRAITVETVPILARLSSVFPVGHTASGRFALGVSGIACRAIVAIEGRLGLRSAVRFGPTGSVVVSLRCTVFIGGVGCRGGRSGVVAVGGVDVSCGRIGREALVLPIASRRMGNGRHAEDGRDGAGHGDDA
jgi:hypothetical protein